MTANWHTRRHRDSGRDGARFSAPLLSLVIALIPFLADARAIRVDDTLQRIELNVADLVFNDGSTGPLPLESYELDSMTGQPDYTANLPFNINFFGNTYSEFYINENGTVSFGAAYPNARPSTDDFANAGTPILAPFFSDPDMTLGGRIFNGFFPFQNAIAITWTNAQYFGQTSGPGNDFQIVIRDRSDITGVAGDFDLEFNYRAGGGGMLWETGDRDGGVNGLGGDVARVGFYDGFGTGYEIPGSGVSGALLGEDCVANPIALDCNDYFFQFRGGLPFQDGRSLLSVPEPGTVWLVLIAGLLLASGLLRHGFQETFEGE